MATISEQIEKIQKEVVVKIYLICKGEGGVVDSTMYFNTFSTIHN